ncbi:hypothetical protein RHGRI_007183 [Rhododendron griersonianum]|uniref:Uncharacterized protein n=1 Tax=Rhododendron griersonianum TaxID=479676 RepID=A0AAV6KWR3_9ERIC|nr:hypothetical protein RHGRI_007183 [Rhododendron griersonianum]
MLSMAQSVSFMAKTFLLMPTPKPYHLRNIFICAKASTNVDSNPVPVINPGSGPQTNNTVNINSDAGGDKSGKTQVDDVKIVKSDTGKAQ